MITKPIDPSLYRTEFKALGSACEIVIGAANQTEAIRCITLAIEEARRIEKKYSRFLDNSVVSSINKAAGIRWVTLDEETESLLNYADKLYEISDGLFDITSGIFRKIWDFKLGVLPKRSQIESILKLIGWSKVERAKLAIRLPLNGMEIDFGGFGKEYAVDRCVTLLAENGISHGFINLGGDLRIVGPKPDGEPWTMGVINPREPQSIIANIPITTGAMATSGDYEKFFDIDGKRYCHVISPLTGYPVEFWRSVTVIAPLAITAGTYTTIAMLKESEGISWINESGLSFFCVDYKGNINDNV